MEESIIKRFNPTDTIEKAIPRLIEAFSLYYGEEERENITKKFNNLLVVGYIKPKTMSSIISEYYRNKTKEYKDKLINNLGLSEDKRKIFFDELANFNANYLSIVKYINYKNGVNTNDYNKKEVLKFVQKIYSDVTIDNLDNKIKNGELELIEKVVEEYLRLLEQFKQEISSLKSYEEYVNKCNDVDTRLSEKYDKIFYQEFMYLLSEEEQKKFLGSRFRVYNLSEKGRCYFEPINPVINSFSSLSENILNSENSSWKKESIIKDRIKFFKAQGIILGDNYDEYAKKDDIKKLIVELQELADKMISRKKELNTQRLNEYYASIEEYKNNMMRINECGFLDKEYDYNAYAYENVLACITPNFKIVDGEIVVSPMLLYSSPYDISYADAFLVHEFNHVYELTLCEFKENNYKTLCGWDLINGTIKQEKVENVSLNKRPDRRGYELFNEVINELISQEITSILFQNNGYVFSNEEKAKIKGGTSYETITKYLVSDFFSNYKKEIIDSRQGNIQILFDKVGQENFEELNKLINESTKVFSSSIILGETINKYKNGEVNEMTSKLKEFISRRDKILNDMALYSKSHSVTR